MQQLRIAYENKEDREQRLERNRQHKEFRHERAERRKGGVRDDIQLANIFLNLGMDYFKIPQEERTLTLLRSLTGRRIDSFQKKQIRWLKDNYNLQEVRDPEGRLVIHFSAEQPKQGDDMKLYSQIAETSGQPRKAVKAVYEALISQIKHELRHERKVRLPELGRIAIRFRKAKPKRKGRNPFNGQEMMFKAKPASNKIAFRPSKDFKKYVDSKIEVKEPPKKKSKSKDKKHKKHKKH